MTPAALPRTVRSRRYLPVLLFVLVGLLPLPLTATPADEPVTVPVARVEAREIPSLVELTGTVQAAERAAISAKISGVVSRVAVSLGSTVAAGEVLVVLEAGEITARLRQAEAQLAQAKRHLERDRGLLAKNAATPETVRTRADQFDHAPVSVWLPAERGRVVPLKTWNEPPGSVSSIATMAGSS